MSVIVPEVSMADASSYDAQTRAECSRILSDAAEEKADMEVLMALEVTSSDVSTDRQLLNMEMAELRAEYSQLHCDAPVVINPGHAASAQSAAETQLAGAHAALSRGECQVALNVYRPLAEQGNVIAQFNLGRIYENGWGVQRDFATALTWLRRAADKGQPDALYSLGGMYASGTGISKDLATAWNLYRDAADRGQRKAQFHLAVSYMAGNEVSRDYAAGATYMSKAAEQGYPLAQQALGNMYKKGLGVPQDYVLAEKWLNIATARISSPVAGISPGSDPVRAAALKDRDEVAAKLTAEQVGEAQKLSREWMSSLATHPRAEDESMTSPVCQDYRMLPPFPYAVAPGK